jgi:hypothetical protein
MIRESARMSNSDQHLATPSNGSLTAPGSSPLLRGHSAAETAAGLTARQEAFCRLYAETGVASQAYASAYDLGSGSRNAARVNSCRLLQNPKVIARVRALQEAAANRSTRSAASLIRDLEEMVEADINELVRLDVGCCRHCWGAAGGYQWRDQAEHDRAHECYRTMRESSKPVPLPADASGGFGYSADRDANPECEQCAGAGVPRVKFTSTADASPGARRLLRGIELYGDGSVKRLLLHDQMAARIELHRLRGLHVERSMSVTAHVNVPALKDMTHEEALNFLESIQPTK